MLPPPRRFLMRFRIGRLGPAFFSRHQPFRFLHSLSEDLLLFVIGFCTLVRSKERSPPSLLGCESYFCSLILPHDFYKSTTSPVSRMMFNYIPLPFKLTAHIPLPSGVEEIRSSLTVASPGFGCGPPTAPTTAIRLDPFGHRIVSKVKQSSVHSLFAMAPSRPVAPPPTLCCCAAPVLRVAPLLSLRRYYFMNLPLTLTTTPLPPPTRCWTGPATSQGGSPPALHR